MSVLTYAKEHPWATGIIVVVGGIIFIMIVRGGGGGESGGGGTSRLSDAEIAANATIAAAQIGAQAQAAQAGAAVQAAQIGAGVQLNSDNQAAAVALAQIEAQRALGLETIGAQERAVGLQIQGETSRYQSIVNSLGQLKKSNRDDVLQALVTGQKFNENRAPSTGNYGQQASGFAGLISSIGSIFSDQRLKENITHVGYDKRGRDIYEYNYKGSNNKRRGYIAQQIARAEPQRVMQDSNTGFLRISTYG